MATGIALPTRVENGRLALLSGDNYIRQLVMTMLGQMDSDNPFQDVGLGEFMIFGINDSMLEGEIEAIVRDRFKTLERDELAKLNMLRFEQDGANGVMTMYVDYIDMETGKRVDLQVPIQE